MEPTQSPAQNLCPSISPEQALPCALPDHPDAHQNGHKSAATPGPITNSIWEVNSGEADRWTVLAIADAHLDRTIPGETVNAHRRRVRGCPWCIEDERADAADELLRSLNPGEWANLSSHTARFLLAADDLKQPPSLFIDGGPGVLNQVNYFGAPPPGASAAAITEAHLIAERARRRERG